MTVRRLLVGVALALAVSSLAVGCGSSGPSEETSNELESTLAHYKVYLQKNGQKLTHWADTIVLKVDEKSFSKAGSRYAAARVPYGHLAPAAQSFPTLNTRIDALERQVPPDEFGGFHEIEKAIFWEKSTYGMKPVARQLRIDIEELTRRLNAAQLEPTQIIDGADQILEGVVENEAWGYAELWAHNDLADVAAKVEGADAAFEAAKPLLSEGDPELVRRIETQLRRTFAKVGEYGILAREPEQARDREPGISFIVYDQPTQEEKWEISQRLEALAEVFSEAKSALADA